MRVEALVDCEGAQHTVVWDAGLFLVDHDLERDLVFDALRYGPSEGCLAIREAWLAVAAREPDRELLETLLLRDPEVRARLRRELGARIAFAPQINAAIEQARGPEGDARPPVEEVARWQRILIGLPESLQLAFCRSLEPGLEDVTEEELRVSLIGAERLAQVLPFRRGP